MKTKLDAAFVAAAECPPGKKKLDVYCSHTRGLMLEVRASGGKTYYIKFTDAHGAQRQMKIGSADQISFAQAVKAARRLIAEVALGGDPLAKKKERRSVPFFNEIAAEHVQYARSYLKSIKTLEGYMRRITARWGKFRLTDIRTQDIAAWAAELRDQGLAPATILKTLVTMSRTFDLSARAGVAGAEKNPVKGVPKPKFSNARQTYIDADQTARLLAAATKSRNTQLPAILGLLLATGMRVTELLSTRWKDVDVDRRTLFIPTSKTGRSRTVPLSTAAVGIIDTLPHPEGATFLFPNPRDSSKRLTTIKHAWQTAREEAGLPELHLHDLRHSFASACVAAGIDLYHVGRLLGHQSHASTSRYAHVANKTLMAAVEAGAKTLNLSVLA